METKSQPSFTDTFIDGARKALIELEALRVQAALGKAEARDAFEVAKKKFNDFIVEAKIMYGNAKNQAQEKSNELQTIFENLQLQLALGKAETRDIFEEQRKKITPILNELEELIKRNKTASEFYAKLQMEVHKFKIKLEILKLRYELNKLDAKDEFESRKVEFSKKLDEIKKRIELKSSTSKDKWEVFREEIAEAYQHLQKAFAS